MANPEVATSGFSRSREIIGELLATLDREAGGDLAQRLASIYAFLLAELDSIAIRGDTMTLERCINIVGELREAFAEASATQAMAS